MPDAVAAAGGVYTLRRPQASPLFRLVSDGGLSDVVHTSQHVAILVDSRDRVARPQAPRERFLPTILMLRLVRDIWQFAREGGKWWLRPMIVFCFLLAQLAWAVVHPVVAPFIYTVF